MIKINDLNTIIDLNDDELKSISGGESPAISLDGAGIPVQNLPFGEFDAAASEYLSYIPGPIGRVFKVENAILNFLGFGS